MSDQQQLSERLQARLVLQQGWFKLTMDDVRGVEALETQRDALAKLLREVTSALEMIYDKWENGDPCFEDPETCSGSLGNAFKLHDEEENQILALIGRDGKALNALATLDRPAPADGGNV